MIDQRTHWDDCWRERSHHDCAVARIESLLMELASQSVPINMDEFRPMTPSEHVKVNNALRARIDELEAKLAAEREARGIDTNHLLCALAAERERREEAEAVIHTCQWAMRQPLDGWKGECERKALDEARAHFARYKKEPT